MPWATTVSATQPADDEPVADRPLLAGPRVEPGARDNAAVEFGGRRRPTPPVPLNRWRRALGTLAFTVDQRTEIAGIMERFVSAQREFNRTYGEEFRALRNEIRSARRARRDVSAATIQRFAEIQAQAPDLPEMQLEIWAALTGEQQDALRAELAPPPRDRTDRAERGRSG